MTARPIRRRSVAGSGGSPPAAGLRPHDALATQLRQEDYLSRERDVLAHEPEYRVRHDGGVLEARGVEARRQRRLEAAKTPFVAPIFPGPAAPPSAGDRGRGRSRSMVRPGAIVATARPGPPRSGAPAIFVAASVPPALTCESMMLRRPVECTDTKRANCPPPRPSLCLARLAARRLSVYEHHQPDHVRRSHVARQLRRHQPRARRYER